FSAAPTAQRDVAYAPTYAFGWTSTIATLALGVVVAGAFGFQLARRPAVAALLPRGAWESRVADGQTGASIVRRIVFTSTQSGSWSERVERSSGITPVDSAPFVLEGPRANRFCLHPSPGTSDCRIIVMSADSLVMMFGTPTVARPAGDVSWVFRPLR